MPPERWRAVSFDDVCNWIGEDPGITCGAAGATHLQCRYEPGRSVKIRASPVEQLARPLAVPLRARGIGEDPGITRGAAAATHLQCRYEPGGSAKTPASPEEQLPRLACSAETRQGDRR
jgi:hypothetical protein